MFLKRGMQSWRPAQIQLKLKSVMLEWPKVPVPFGHVHKNEAWGMLGNSDAGDCVFAGGAHEEMVWAMATGRPVPLFTSQSVLADYGRVTGYDPKNPSSDQGSDPIAVASWRRNTGITTADGKNLKIKAYASVENLDELDVACYLFGAVGVGLELPASAEQQFISGHPWTDTVSKPIGGHYICYVGRNSVGDRFFITWGGLQAASDAYLKKWFIGGIAYLSPSYLTATGKSPEMLDIAKLEQFLTALN